MMHQPALRLLFVCMTTLGWTASLRAQARLRVVGGTTTIEYDAARLQRLGLSIGHDARLKPGRGHASITLAIDPTSTMIVAWSGGSDVELVGGTIRHLGELVLRTTQGAAAVDRPVMVRTTGTGLEGRWRFETEGETGGLVLGRFKAGIDQASRNLTIHCPDLLVSAELARGLGRPDLANRAIGRMTIHADTVAIDDGAVFQPPPWTPGPLPRPRRTGPDMAFCELYDLRQFGREADIVGLSVATTSWNIGDEDLMWFPRPETEHPFIVMNLYRLKDERFEQIGQSSIKHGFYALGSTDCGGTCTYEPGHSTGRWLGVGCTDLYSSGLNASQSGLAPRHEVNAWTGAFTYPGSHLALPHSSHDGVEHRLQVRDADLDPALNPGASYFVEGYYAVIDDVNVMNSAAWKPAGVSGSPGGLWSFAVSGRSVAPNVGFAIDAWTGAASTMLAQEVPPIEFISPDGRCILAAEATDLGGGLWHYEYALLNIDMSRNVGSFTIPVSPLANVTNVGFHAVASHDEPYSNTAWSATVAGGEITWDTIDNPVRWGTLYNFRFDADVEPIPDATVTLGMFQPGAPATVTGLTTGPTAGSPDCNGNGIPDPCDLDCNAPGCGQPCGGSLDCNANGIPDECEPDCNGNGVPDDCDIAAGTSPDCQPNGIPDECEDGVSERVNNGDFESGVLDGWSQINSINGKFVIDNGTVDPAGPGAPLAPCEGVFGVVNDANGAGTYRLYQEVTIPPDVISATLSWTDQIRNHWSAFVNPDQAFRVEIWDTGNFILEEVFSTQPGDPLQQQCTPRSVDLSAYAGQTIRVAFVCQAMQFYMNVHLDDIHLESVQEVDCNQNGVPDECDIASGFSGDCQPNGKPDECEPDCNNNSIPDDCDIAAQTSPDCNHNGVPDECEPGARCDNDTCGFATAIWPGVYEGSTIGADGDGDASCGQSTGSPDLWYSYTPASGGILTVETCGGGDFDTVLSVHSGCPGTTANELACDDNGCPLPGGASRLSMPVTGGVTYLIRVSGHDGASGDFLLTLAGPDCAADGVRGGLMWDKWWTVNNAVTPTETHPLYPPIGQKSGSTTHRCKECHGWDYKGAAGAYGSGSHYTGIAGVFGSTLTASEMFDLIRNDAPPAGHGFWMHGLGLSDQDTWDLVRFLQQRVIDTDAYIDPVGRFIGDENQGGINYNAGGLNCAVCHGPDGAWINFGTPQAPEWVGTVAVNNPGEMLHKTRFGQPGTIMPSWLGTGGTNQGAADIGLFAQRQLAFNCVGDPDCDDGDPCNGTERCVNGHCTYTTLDGDMNEDGLADGRDMAVFVSALVSASVNPVHIAHGDFNEDGKIDPADTPCFVTRLLAP